MSEYSKMYKDPRWQKKRLEIFERDNWACQMCGDTKSTLNVHHKYYESRRHPWEYDNRCLATLCDDCHDLEHSTKKDYEEILLSTLYDKGLFSIDIIDLAYSISCLSQEKIFELASVHRKRRDRTPSDAKVTP